MTVCTVDLYKQFNIDRGENEGGYLTCYLHHNTREVNSERRYPAMVVFPGGAYVFCSDREAEPVAEAYYSKGFNSFVLRYSVEPSRFPTQLIEAAMAMAYVRRNADDLLVDADHVATVGFSAGGHLCGSVTTMYNYPEVTSLGFLPKEIRPNASILSYAVISTKYSHICGETFYHLCLNKEEVLKRVSIEELVTPDTPPVFLWHTANDGCVNIMHCIRMAEALAKNGVPFNVHIFENGEHGLSLCDESVYPVGKVPLVTSGSEEWFDLSVKWLKDRGFGYKY